MADTHKVRVLLTAEAGRLRRELRSAAGGTERLGRAFTGAAGKGDAMAGRVQAAGARIGQAQREAGAAVGRLGDAFTAARPRPGELAAVAEGAGERVEGAQREAGAAVGRLGDAFTAARPRPGELAAVAEGAGERVEGAQREAGAAVGRLGRAFLRAGNQATTMGQQAAAARRRIAGTVGSLGAAFGLAGGAFAIGASAKRIATIETRMERLGVQSGRSSEEMRALRDEIYEVANAPDIRVDPSELTAAIEAVVEKTGDLDFARENLRTLAESIQGAGGTGDAQGRLTAELRKFGLITQTEVAGALNLITAQGKSGAFTLGNMAAQGERLFSAFAGLGYTGPGAVRELGALAQVARQATGSSEQATTAVEALLRSLADASKLEKIENELGVEVRMGDGSFRDISQILNEIVGAVGGDMVKLSEIFDAEALRVFNALTEQGRQDYRGFLGLQVRGDELSADAARIAGTTEAKAQDIRTSFEAKLTEYFTGPLRGTATAIAEFQGEIVAAAGAGFLLTGAFKAAKGGVGLLAAMRGKGEAAETLGETTVALDDDARDKRDGPGRRVAQMRVGTMHVGRMVGGAGGKKKGSVGGSDALVGGAAGAGIAASMGESPDKSKRTGMGGRMLDRAFKAVPVLGTGIILAETALDLAGVDVGELVSDLFDRRDAAMERNGSDPSTTHPRYRARELDLGPPPLKTPVSQPAPRGNVRYRGQPLTVTNNITVQSDAADPKQVAQEVADEIERRQHEQRLRLDDTIIADGPSEIIL